MDRYWYVREYLWIDRYVDWYKDRWIYLKLDVHTYKLIIRLIDFKINNFMYHRIFKRRKRSKKIEISKEKERNRGIEKKMDGKKQK